MLIQIKKQFKSLALACYISTLLENTENTRTFGENTQKFILLKCSKIRSPRELSLAEWNGGGTRSHHTIFNQKKEKRTGELRQKHE